MWAGVSKVANAVVSGESGVGVLVSDNFTAADGTAINGRTPDRTPGGNWTLVNISAASTFKRQVQSSKQQQVGTGGSEAAGAGMTVDHGNANVTISCDITPVEGSISGLIFRVTDGSNYSMAVIDENGGTGGLGELEIWQEDLGVAAIIGGSEVDKTITPGVELPCTLTLNGSSISWVVDGTESTGTSSTRSTITNHGTGNLAGSVGDNWDNYSAVAT